MNNLQQMQVLNNFISQGENFGISLSLNDANKDAIDVDYTKEINIEEFSDGSCEISFNNRTINIDNFTGFDIFDTNDEIYKVEFGIKNTLTYQIINIDLSPV